MIISFQLDTDSKLTPEVANVIIGYIKGMTQDTSSTLQINEGDQGARQMWPVERSEEFQTPQPTEPGVADAPPPAAKPARKRTSSPKPVSTVVVPEETPETLAEYEDPDKVITAEELRAIVQEKALVGKKDDIRSLCQEYGVKSVTLIPESERLGFYVKVQAL